MACAHDIRTTSSSSRTWLIAHVVVPPALSDEAIEALSSLATNGLEEDHRNGNITLRAYFDAASHTPRSLITSIQALIPGGRVAVTEMNWDNDDRRWRQFFSPFEIIPGVIVAPSWEYYEPTTGQHVITLDPGMAFGTGLHATTRMCALAIDTWHRENQAPSSLLDVGCGSGILCLIGHVRGLRPIAAVENDPDAARIARDNFSGNGASFIPVHESLDVLHDSYSLVVANILLNTLITLKEQLVHLTKPGGWLVLSGITDDQIDELECTFSDGMQRKMVLAEDEWSCVVLERNH